VILRTHVIDEFVTISCDELKLIFVDLSDDCAHALSTLRYFPGRSGFLTKLSHYTLRRRLEGEDVSSYSFSTSAVDGSEWSVSRPDRALPPRKGPPVPIVQEAGWAPEPVWTQRLEEKSFRLCRGSNLHRPVQSVSRNYTD
jgi:hypothetical protein